MKAKDAKRKAKVTISVYLPRETYQKLAEKAEAEKRSVSSAVELAIDAMLQERATA